MREDVRLGLRYSQLLHARDVKRDGVRRHMNRRHDPKLGGGSEQDRADGDGLQHQSCRYRDRFEIIGKADDRNEQGRSENHDGEVRTQPIGTGQDGAGYHQRRRNHRDACSLRRWDMMGRPRIRLCKRVFQEQGPEGPGQARRQHRRGSGRQKRKPQFGNGHAIQRRRYSGTWIGAAPWAAFSAEKIHTSPPKAPTMNDTAPYSREILMPSFVISPA